MKKLNVLLLLTLSLFLLTGCNKKATEESTVNPTPEVAQAAQPTDIPAPTESANEDTQEDLNPADPTQKIDIRIAALKGPTAIGMVQVMDNAAKEETANNYTFTIAGAADEISAGLIKGDFDIAALPCNLASVLYNKTEGKLVMAGINTLNVLYIVETGNSIQTVEDLKGKTIYSTGFGTTPQYTLNYLLNAYGIDPEKDVTIEYKTEATEVAALLSEATDAIALLPQPFVTTVMMNNDKVRVALDVAKEWDAVSTDGSSVVTGVVVVRKEFLENNGEAFDAFLSEYAASASYVNTETEAAAMLVEQFDIVKAAVAKQAIPFCNISLIQGDEMKEKVNGYLTALYNQNPQAVGGKLPADDFYYLP
ncbi:MAG: hypothetical protein K0S47_658 [Herbinix sp.]|jgi:NitT/TauT family transport system substrate-binding protein|nr:hypothetical protein [Herbinix sp.]